MSVLLAWLLTYLVHSTLLLGAAWAAQKVLGERHLPLQERVLRFALVGAILTASLQVALPLEPAAGRLSLVAAAPPAPSGAATSPFPAPRPTPARTELPWPALAAALWALGAAAAAARLGVASLRLQRVLGSGRVLVDGALPRTAHRVAGVLGLRRAVELRASDSVCVPFAAGIRRPRVCLPERVLTDLAPREQEGLCAHELAHLRRRDPEWVLAYRVVAGTLFFQPLNHWATRQLGELSECLSDELAAHATGRAPELARSLVEVADWTTGSAPLPAATALRAPRGLGRRIERLEKLMRDPRTGRATPTQRRGALPLAALALFAGTALLPGVSGRARAQAPESTEAEEKPLSRIEERLEQAAEEREALRAEERRAREEQRALEAADREAQREHERDVEREVDALIDADAMAGLEEAMRQIEIHMEEAAAEIEAALEGQSEEIERALEAAEPDLERLRLMERDLAEQVGEQLEQTRRRHRELQDETRQRHREQLQIQREVLRERQLELRRDMREMRERVREDAQRLRLSAQERAEIRERVRTSLPDRDRLQRLSRQLSELTRRLTRSFWAGDDAPEPPEPPEAPEPPEVPEVPEVPEAPEVPEPPEVPEAPEAPTPLEAPAPPRPGADVERGRVFRGDSASARPPRVPLGSDARRPRD